MVITRYGIVASEHPLASQIGANVLASGGNAIDAAVAANAAMGLFGPMMNGIGGDLFAIVYEAKTGKLHGLNASGWALIEVHVAFCVVVGLHWPIVVPPINAGCDMLNPSAARQASTC